MQGLVTRPVAVDRGEIGKYRRLPAEVAVSGAADRSSRTGAYHCGVMAGGTAGILQRPAVPGPFLPCLHTRAQEKVIIIYAASIRDHDVQVNHVGPLAPEGWRAPVQRTRHGWPGSSACSGQLFGGVGPLMASAAQARLQCHALPF